MATFRIWQLLDSLDQIDVDVIRIAFNVLHDNESGHVAVPFLGCPLSTSKPGLRSRARFMAGSCAKCQITIGRFSQIAAGSSPLKHDDPVDRGAGQTIFTRSRAVMRLENPGEPFQKAAADAAGQLERLV
jgi:hypothetical protein